MSRCFPFPPPGYSSAAKEIVSELIKLQEEKQLKKEKKQLKEEKRRQKKERRERREERKNKKEKACPNSDKSDIVKVHIGQQVSSDHKDKFSKTRSEAKCEKLELSSEKLELSSVTEEYGYPNSLPGPASSCESTENTSNRKKRASPEDNGNGQREPILIRLPSKRQEVCSTEGIINIRNNREETCLTTRQIGAGNTNRPISDYAVNSMQGVELRYKDLLENWLPPRLQDTSLYTHDSDWLFSNREKQDEKRQRCGTGGNVSCCRSLETWARAEYLPEVGVFALPYVIPY